MIHDPGTTEPSQAFALSRLTQGTCGATPIGIFRAVDRPVYDELMAEQLETARTQKGEGDLEKLLHAGDTWSIG
jgi:2-oxoglutarate ferredoxin oxidoreductase subunit beta